MISSIDGCGWAVYLTPLSHEAAIRRQAEVEAVQTLVRHVFGAEATLCHQPNGAPFIAGRQCPISISHSRKLAALAVAQDGYKIGIDVEEPREQLLQVARRFLSEAENTLFGNDLGLLLRAWTLKEALYKAHGRAGIDLRHDIYLPPVLAAGQKAHVGGAAYQIQHLAPVAGTQCTLAVVTCRNMPENL